MRVLKEQTEGDVVEKRFPTVLADFNFARGLFAVFPPCFKRYILGRHGHGNIPIPADKGVALSCRIVRGGNFCTVILCNGCNLTSAVGIKGYCILIDFPLCFNRYILRRHGFGDFLIPSLKGITFSCRVGGSGNIRAVVLRNGCNLAAACGVKGDCVPIDFPLCFNRYILRRHGFGDFLIPSLKGITFSCRVGGSGNIRAVVLRNGCNLAAACGVKGDCVPIDFPLCRDSNILGRHGHGNIPVPADKGVALSCRVGRGGDIRAVVLRNRSDLAAACGVKGDCVPIDFPLCRDSNILRRHGFGDFLIPALKGITFSCWVVRGGNFRTVVLSNGCNLTSAVGIKGYCVPIDFPLCRDSHILGGHGRGNFPVPADKGISFSCRVGRSGNWCAVILRYGNIRFAVFGLDCDGILIDFPLRPIFLVARFGVADCRNRRAGQIFVVIPALEGVPGARHICRECCTHAVGVFGDIAVVDRAAVCVQGYGIGRGCPLHRQFRHISRNAVAGGVGIAIAVKPHKVTACISGRAGHAVGRRGGKCAAVFHDDVNSIGAAAQLAAAKVEGNGFQPVSAQRAGVRDFKDGAEAEGLVRGIVAGPETGRTLPPANRTERRRNSYSSILSTRKHLPPVFDISVVLIQYLIPFVAFGRAAF